MNSRKTKTTITSKDTLATSFSYSPSKNSDKFLHQRSFFFVDPSLVRESLLPGTEVTGINFVVRFLIDLWQLFSLTTFFRYLVNLFSTVLLP